MKSKFLFVVSLLLAGSLVACDLGGGGNNNQGGGDNNQNSNSSSGDVTINLGTTIEEAKNKLHQLGLEQGFEITFRSEGEAGEADDGVDTMTVGYKSDVLWVPENAAYKKVDTNIELYEWQADKNSYEFQGQVPESTEISLDYYLGRLTNALYIGYEIASNPQAGYISAVKDTTFLGRAAKEYTYSYRGAEGSADIKLIFDKDTGITLKVEGKAMTASGDASSGMFEITSFKVGSQVTVPTLNKNSGEGGQQGGEGGQAQTDVFSNKLLMYVSNENANVYVGSKLALFADGKFELTFSENGYLIVMLGEYTVASNKTSATLSVKKVYKDQGKEYSTLSETWTLTYADNAYALQVSAKGKVNFMASAVAPTHADIPAEGQGGQGQGGESDVDNFVNHLFVYVSQQSAPTFVDSTVALFNDATFEIVTHENGKLIVYFGSYTVNASDTEASLTVSRVYKEQTGNYNDYVGNWKLGLQKNGVYHLNMPAATVVYNLSSELPTHQNLPSEGQGQQGGEEDKRFQVTSTIWNTIVEENDIVHLDSNFTVMVVSSDNPTGYVQYKFDNGKVRILDHSLYGDYEYYRYYTEEGATEYTQNTQTGAWEDKDLGTVNNISVYNSISVFSVVRVPFAQVAYSSDTHGYECASFKDQYGAEYTDIRIEFDNNQLTKASYKDQYGYYHESEIAARNATKVTLPEVGGGSLTPAQLNDLVRNRVYAFDSATAPADYPNARKLNAMFAGNTISFFTDDTFEFVYNKMPNYETGEGVEGQYVFQGTYQVQEDANQNGYNDIRVTFTKAYFNGVENNMVVGGSAVFKITPSINTMTIEEYVSESIIITCLYAKVENATPTHVQIVEPPVVEDKWPAKDIAAKLSQLNLNVELPVPYTDNANIVSVTDEVVDNTLKIVITFSSSLYVQSESYYYFNRSGGENPAFTIDYNLCDGDGVVGYANADKTIQALMSLDEDTNAITIIVSKYGRPYPTNDIAIFCRSNELTSPLPSLQMDNVSYRFDPEYGELFMTPFGNNTVENILSQMETILLRNRFTVQYNRGNEEDPLEPVYVDPSQQYYVTYFEIMGAICVNITVSDQAPWFAINKYPTDYINTMYPYGMRERLPDLSIENAIYSYSGFGEGFYIEMSMQLGMNAKSIVDELGQRLLDNRYKFVDGAYESPEGSIRVTFEIFEDKLILINVYLDYEVEDVTYTFVNHNEWEIEQGVEELWVYLWDANGDYLWTPLLKDDESGAYYIETDSHWIGCKVVRFEKDSVIDWAYGPDGSANAGVTIYNETGDIYLPGVTGDIDFTLN